MDQVIKKIDGKEVRWGIIGVGDVCEVKSAPAMQKIAGSRLVAVMRRDSAKAADYAKRHQVPRWYDQVKDLISDPEVNAIYIATPPSSHHDLVVQAALSGKPIYVEKPMALSYPQCQSMNTICDDNAVPLYVAYYRRSLPNFLKIKELLDQDAIGEIRAVEIKLTQYIDTNVVAKTDHNWRVYPEISGGGYFVDLASHQLDLLDFLIGPISKAEGISHNQAGLYPAEDVVVANWQFRSGVVGTGLWCFTTAKIAQQEKMRIIGAKGQISFQCFGSPDVLLEQDDELSKTFNYTYPQHIQQPHITSIVNDLLGEGICPSTGRIAARTNLILDQILGK